jgi:hypothetical protein
MLAELNERFVSRDPVVLLVDRDHATASPRALPCSALSGQPLIATGARSGVRGLVENIQERLSS